MAWVPTLDVSAAHGGWIGASIFQTTGGGRARVLGAAMEVLDYRLVVLTSNRPTASTHVSVLGNEAIIVLLEAMLGPISVVR